MFYVLSWLVVLVLFIMWSLGAWALHAVAIWSASNVGALSGHAKRIEDLKLPDWLAPWFPADVLSAIKSLTIAALPAVESVLAIAPALGGGLSVAVWVVWGAGCLLLLLLGVVSHVLIAILRRRSGGPRRP